MQQNYSSTKAPTVAATNVTGHTSPTVVWSNPNNILLDDGSSASWGAYLPGQGANIVGSVFGFQQLPDEAVIDGIVVVIDGSQTGCFGDVTLNIAGTTGKAIGTLNTSYGGPTDLWGADVITPADIAALAVAADTEDVSGGDGIASMDYMTVTVYWHIEMANIPDADVPTRFDYKVYTADGAYLGLLPKVTSKFGFAQDINSAGSTIQISCGKFVKNEVTATPLLTEAGDIITTEDDLPILATQTDTLVTLGDSVDDAIFKNGNRIKVWMYNRYYPNGKLVFSGQVNRIDIKYGGSDAQTRLTVYSDGLDLNNFIARGYPFAYTQDVSNTVQNTYAAVTQDSKGAGWDRWGQTWQIGAGVTTLGAISIRLNGVADVTITVYDGLAGNLLGSVTQAVNTAGTPTVVQFGFPNLIDVVAGGEYFFTVSVGSGQSISLYCADGNPYANGILYRSQYAGGSGGGSYIPHSSGQYDAYFITYSGSPTTTVTYSTDDPVSDMAHGILLDYNLRGGYITERDFDATGLSLTYTFVVATILDALKKIIEMCQAGYYYYIDLGTAEIDIKQMNTAADYTVVRGRHISELNLALSIEQVKNYLLFSGGEVSPGVNLYQYYSDSESANNYGLRTVTKSDNRVTTAATADAIGDSFLEESAGETQETTLIVKDEDVDITQFLPGKTIGFRNFGNFIDDMVLQIVRREVNFSDGTATLTLGRLPIRMNDEVQRLIRGLSDQQTINNPTAPS